MLLDIGIGILAAIFLSSTLHISAIGWWIGAGIVFALLPDADYLLYLVTGGSSHSAHKHRDLLHYPFLYIPVGMVLLALFGTSWSLLFGICSLAHFIHDSIGIGWGVQWLWPISCKHFSFFYIYKPRHKTEKLPRKLLYAWEHGAIEELNARYGDEEWIRNIYLRWHPYAIAELIVFLIALFVLFSYLR